MDIVAVISKLDRLPAGAAAALAFGRTFGPPRRQKLKLLKTPEQFRSE
jgi:hypothetical protein